MTFQEEMDRFFRAYSEKDRNRVDADTSYQAAATNEDATRAQAIACELLEGFGHTKKQAKEDREDKRVDRFWDL
jgi:hypothetical protein